MKSLLIFPEASPEVILSSTSASITVPGPGQCPGWGPVSPGDDAVEAPLCFIQPAQLSQTQALQELDQTPVVHVVLGLACARSRQH